VNAMILTRRQTLFSAALGAASLSIPAFAAAPGAGSKRLVVILLRGGLDGLAAAPPLGDPSHEAARRGLALLTSGERAALKLDGFFGLHPALPTFAQLYAAKQLTVIHAAGSPYRERSHFDAQNVLETGANAANARASGWLNAALAGLPQASAAGRKELAIAMAQQAPLILRGAAPAATWSPSPLPDADADTLMRLMDLYNARDPVLAKALAGAKEANMLAAEMGGGGGGGRNSAFASLAQTAAKFLKKPDGPVAAVLDLSGWDTHANQQAMQGQLTRSLSQLDAGIAALQTELGPAWRDTVVVVATEFGRTVAMNGTRGTDHGSGAAAFLLGGAVAGGKIIADWPGLAPGQLNEGRDLRITTDLFAVLKGVLGDHLGVSRAALDGQVFPANNAAPRGGLILA
jgi:uncharacterized protein (DUF1501 family)